MSREKLQYLQKCFTKLIKPAFNHSYDPSIQISSYFRYLLGLQFPYYACNAFHPPLTEEDEKFLILELQLILGTISNF